jgi:hypothetical protein
VGAWGGFDPSTLTIQPKADVTVPFTVTAPKNAEPGDHIGAVVAESLPEKAADGNLLALVKRVAVRLYITIPGEATPNFVIQKIDVQPDSGFFPREATVKVMLRNTGRVRIAPTVTIGGARAKGSALLLSRSVEPYVVTAKVPIWGGPQRYKVDVGTRLPSSNLQGPFRQASVSRFYIPWALLVALALFAALVLLVRRWLRRRGGKYAEMRADMKRIERLLAEQRGGAALDTMVEDPEVAIKSAIKRAGRAGDKDAEERLKEKLAEHRAAQVPAPSEEAPLLAEPAPAAAPEPAPQPEPARAMAASDAYDFLREAPTTPEGATEPEPKDFYDSLREHAPPPAPETPRVPVQAPMGPGYFVPDPVAPSAKDADPTPVAEEAVAAVASPEFAPPAPQPAVVVNDADDAPAAPGPERDETLVVLLRELSSAPKRRQEALIRAARSYGVLTLRSHADLVEQLPAEVRAKLLPKQVI